MVRLHRADRWSARPTKPARFGPVIGRMRSPGTPGEVGWNRDRRRPNTGRRRFCLEDLTQRSLRTPSTQRKSLALFANLAIFA